METNETMKATLWREAEAAVQQLIERLQGMKEGDLKAVEEQVLTSVFALGRQWMAGVVGASAAGEEVPLHRQGACGHEQRLVDVRPKQVLTLLGKVSYRRPYYQCQLETGEDEAGTCTHGEAPADALWGLVGRRSTPGVQQAVSYLAAQGTLEEAAESFSRLLPLQMSARQVLTLMQPVGEALAAQEDAQVQRLFQQAAQARTEAADDLPSREEEVERLYIEMDGVTARLRRGSVPMEEKEQRRAGDVYREVKVGAVFAASQGPERSGLAPGVFVDEAGQKHYVARRCPSEDFGKLLYALAIQHGLARARQVVVLGDGAPWIWRLAEHHFPGAIQIVDLWHADQHVWQVAYAVFGRTTPEARDWARSAGRLLVHGRIKDLVAEIAALPPIPSAPGESRSVPEKAISYFITNAARMRYPAFRAQGLHVGSGIAEAACKTVVSTRAKRSGMRWTPHGLDAVLALRTAVLNGTYGDFCQQHSRLVA